SGFSPRIARRCAGRTARSFSCARSHRRSRWRSIGLRCDGSAQSPEGHGPALEGNEELALTIGGSERAQTYLLVFFGFCIGWVSTTIARYVYPPPKRWGLNRS